MRTAMLGCVLALVIAGCGGKKDEAKKDEGKENLESFKAHIGRDLPNWSVKSMIRTVEKEEGCLWSDVDVKKTGSVASPYEGHVIGRRYTMYTPEDTRAKQFDVDFRLVFKLEDKNWVCSGPDSEVRGQHVESGESPCGRAKLECSVEARERTRKEQEAKP
jgi:hypothetical protein